MDETWRKSYKNLSMHCIWHCPPDSDWVVIDLFW